MQQPEETILAKNPAGFEGLEITLREGPIEEVLAQVINGIAAWRENDPDKAMACWVASRMLADRMTPEQIQSGLELVQGWTRDEENPDLYEGE